MSPPHAWHLWSSNNSISFFNNPKYLDLLKITKAAIVIIHSESRELRKGPVIISNNPYLYFAKVDQLDVSDGIQINNVGDEPSQDYPGFSPGQDFFEGRDTYHNLVYRNLNYEQFRWDDRNIYYYINDDGEFVVRINQSYTYPTDV